MNKTTDTTEHGTMGKASEAADKCTFRARLITHLSQAEIESFDRLRTADDDRRFFAGPDWNKTLVVGSKRAAKIAYQTGTTVIDRDGAVYCATVTNGWGGRPVLVRMR